MFDSDSGLSLAAIDPLRSVVSGQLNGLDLARRGAEQLQRRRNESQKISYENCAVALATGSWNVRRRTKETERGNDNVYNTHAA